MRKAVLAGVLGVSLALGLAGCMTVGTKVDSSTVKNFTPGVTTIDQAETALGKPNQVTRNEDGSTTVQYIYIKSHANGASYVPIVGLFAGKGISDSVTTTLEFDKNGKFEKYSTSQGHTEAGMMGG